MSASVYMAHHHATRGNNPLTRLMFDALDPHVTPAFTDGMVILRKRSVPFYALYPQHTEQENSDSLV